MYLVIISSFIPLFASVFLIVCSHGTCNLLVREYGKLFIMLKSFFNFTNKLDTKMFTKICKCVKFLIHHWHVFLHVFGITVTIHLTDTSFVQRMKMLLVYI